MNSIKPYIDSLLKIWQENSPAARIGLILLAALCLVAIGGVGYWSVQPSYVVLVSELDGSKVDKVIDALDKAGIEFQLSGAGGNVSVDKRNYSKARQIIRTLGVTDSVDIPETAAGGGIFDSPGERRTRALQHKERSLAATVMKIHAVQHADVHLNVPDRGPFERKSTPASASVMLTLRPGEKFTDLQAAAVANFVAYAVENLEPEAVQITDKSGRSYTVAEEGAQQIGTQTEYVSHIENKLVRKAQQQLIHFLGFGNASVQLSLDYTFTNGSMKKTSYDKDGKVAEQEQLETESKTGVDPVTAGPAGTASNLQSRGSQSGAVDSKKENISSTYLVPITEQTESNTTPIRNFMSVSVLVNSLSDVAKQEDGTIPPDLGKKIEEIVKNAVGFKADTDTISVQFLPFSATDTEATEVAVPFNWAELASVVESGSLAIAALLATLLGFMLLKRIKPSAQDATSGERSQSDRRENMTQLSELIKKNPEVFTQIVKSWSGVDSESSTENAAASNESAELQRKAA